MSLASGQLRPRSNSNFLLLVRSIISWHFGIPVRPESHARSHAATVTFQKPIRRVSVIGAGPMAVSWAAYYFARGFDVVFADPARQTVSNPSQEAHNLLSTMLGPARARATRGTLTVTSDLDQALLRADFVQECAPGTAGSKVDLLAEMAKCTRPDSLIASDINASSMNAVQSSLLFGDRFVIARSCDLPHRSPFTVILNSAGTSPLAIRHVIKFYSGIGRLPICLQGHAGEDFVDTMLALFREEAARLRELDIVSERDLYDFDGWAPALCCSAVVGAIQSRNMLDKGLLHNLEGSWVGANLHSRGASKGSEQSFRQSDMRSVVH